MAAVPRFQYRESSGTISRAANTLHRADLIKFVMEKMLTPVLTAAAVENIRFSQVRAPRR